MVGLVEGFSALVAAANGLNTANLSLVLMALVAVAVIRQRK